MAGAQQPVLVAHFHHVIIPGVVFGTFAGCVYWFPKAFGFTLDERWGRRAFWCWFIGFHVAFMPLYVVGLMGMTRRLQRYDVISWQPWLLVAAAGAVVIFAGVVCQIVQLVVWIRVMKCFRDVTGIPGTAARSNGRRRHRRRPGIMQCCRRSREEIFDQQTARTWARRPTANTRVRADRGAENSAIGFVDAFFAVTTGFALIWHIWWMAILGLLGAFAAFLAFAFHIAAESKFLLGRSPNSIEFTRLRWHLNVVISIDDVQPEALISGTEAGPASKRIVVGFGFWIFLLSDIVMFSALFASYAVLVNATAGGPSGAQLFNQVTVAIETACLLFRATPAGL